MKNIFLFLFVLVSAGEIISTIVNVPFLHLVCKPAIMIALGFYYWASQRNAKESFSFPLLFAIFFSLAGDVLLMQQSDEKFFMLGLGSFLMAHIFYILAYRQHRQGDSTEALQGLQRIRFAFPIILAGTGLATILYPHLGDLKVPVILYTCVITGMVLTSLFRFGRTSTASFALVFGGAILFMISDSLIAINKFLEPLPQANLWVMITYSCAQLLIVSGLVRHS